MLEGLAIDLDIEPEVGVPEIWNEKFKYYTFPLKNIPYAEIDEEEFYKQWKEKTMENFAIGHEFDELIVKIEKLYKRNKNKFKGDLFIGMHGILKVILIKGGEDDREINFECPRSKNAKVTKVNQIENIVKKWIRSIYIQLEKLTESGDEIKIIQFNIVDVYFKWVKNNKGGRYISICPKYAKSLYNPISEWNCLFDAITINNGELKFNLPIAKIRG